MMIINIPAWVSLMIFVIAIYFNALFVLYYQKARKYKKQLGLGINQNSALNSSNKPYNSAADITMENSQLKGEETKRNMMGYRKYTLINVAAITEKMKPMILPMVSILEKVYHVKKSKSTKI